MARIMPDKYYVKIDEKCMKIYTNVHGKYMVKSTKYLVYIPPNTTQIPPKSTPKYHQSTGNVQVMFIPNTTTSTPKVHPEVHQKGAAASKGPHEGSNWHCSGTLLFFF